jgi:hypothetical protein
MEQYMNEFTTDALGRPVSNPEFRRKQPTIVIVWMRPEEGEVAFTPPDFKDGFRAELKDIIPFDFRRWDADNQLWIIDERWAETAIDILTKWFPDTEPVWCYAEGEEG